MSDDDSDRNGGARVVPRGRFPHTRRVGDTIYISGTSARRPDNSIAGASADHLGTTNLDIREQTRAVLAAIAGNLAEHDAGLADLVQVTTYLVSMNDFGGYNEVWAEVFADITEPPTRTTVAVHQLPHPHLLLEIQAIAQIRPRPERPGGTR